MKNIEWIYCLISIFLVSLTWPLCAAGTGERKYSDLSYHSRVFGKTKEYRIYLPDSYHQNSNRFPVIYFFHGWGGRHFKDDNAKLEYEKIQKLVDQYKIILVMWDGNMEKSEPRPYNIGVPSQVQFDVQMKDYFPELVKHIDSTFRTRDNRYARGIIGYSMGGFMSFFLAGKYPHMVSAAVNLTGSPEFYVGYPNDNTLYPLRHTFSNLCDVQLRLHNSSEGELSSLNREVHYGALREPCLTYEYWEFEGGHKVDDPGETIVFEKAMNFVNQAFQKPQARKKYWFHYDLYRSFNVWEYQVESNKKEPGFLFLRHVSPSGFGFYSRQWLPDGPSLEEVSVDITTAPVYQPESEYHVKIYNQKKDSVTSSILNTDREGRLKINLSGTGFECGIYKKGGSPRVTFLGYSVGADKRFIRAGEKNSLTIKIGNLGEDLDSSKKVTFELSTNDSTVALLNARGETYFNRNLQTIKLPPVSVKCDKFAPTDGRPTAVKFSLMMKYDTLRFQEEFEVPVFFDVSEFGNIIVDDGKLVKDSVFGVGNGDGRISSGEEVMIYVDGHRTKLFTDDPYVETAQERLYEETLPAKWAENGVTQSSVIRVANDCPKGHIITFLAKYETKNYMPISRNVFWGKVKLIVK